MIKRILLTFCLIAAIFGCVKVSNLSNKGIVESFTITTNSISEGVELAEITPVTIETDESGNNYIYINCVKGKHISPIEFSATIVANETADKILPLTADIANFKLVETDANNKGTYEFSFTDVGKSVSFYVIAESGEATKWEAKLNFADLSEDANITTFEIKTTPVGVVISQTPAIQNNDKQIGLYTINNTFPIVIEPTIEVNPKATITGDYSELTFTSFEDVKTITITSESGSIAEWKIKLYKAEEMTDPSTLSDEQLSRMALNYEKTKPTIEGTTEELQISIDNLNSSLAIYVPAAENIINLNIVHTTGAEIIGNQNIAITTTPADIKYIYMMDTESKMYRKWNISARSENSGVIIVKGASFGSYTPTSGEIVNPTPIINTNDKSITFNVNIENFDVTLNGLVCETNSEALSLLPKTLKFTKNAPSHIFDISALGVIEKWNIKMVYKPVSSEANLIDFELNKEIDWSKTYIENVKKRITVAVNQSTNLEFTPKFIISDGAKITSVNGNISNNVLSTIAIDTPETLTLTAEDGKTTSEWIIEFIYAPQLVNNDFTDVRTNKGVVEAVDWGTANVTDLITLIGTNIVNRGGNNGNAVECTTLKQNALFFGNVVAAATAFKGKFVFALALDYPRLMTKFGIPFTVSRKPVSYSIDVKYIAGPQMQQAIKSGTVYSIKNTDGIDECQVWAEMLNYTENGGDMSKVEFSYSGEGKNGKGGIAEGVTLISRADLTISGSDTQYNNWVNDKEVNFVEKNSTAEVTHLAIMITSSKRGDIYRGAIGSKIWADNIIINYYQPEAGATIKKKD